MQSTRVPVDSLKTDALLNTGGASLSPLNALKSAVSQETGASDAFARVYQQESRQRPDQPRQHSRSEPQSGAQQTARTEQRPASRSSSSDNSENGHNGKVTAEQNGKGLPPAGQAERAANQATNETRTSAAEQATGDDAEQSDPLQALQQKLEDLATQLTALLEDDATQLEGTEAAALPQLLTDLKQLLAQFDGNLGDALKDIARQVNSTGNGSTALSGILGQLQSSGQGSLAEALAQITAAGKQLIGEAGEAGKGSETQGLAKELQGLLKNSANLIAAANAGDTAALNAKTNIGSARAEGEVAIGQLGRLNQALQTTAPRPATPGSADYRDDQHAGH